MNILSLVGLVAFFHLSCTQKKNSNAEKPQNGGGASSGNATEMESPNLRGFLSLNPNTPDQVSPLSRDELQKAINDEDLFVNFDPPSGKSPSASRQCYDDLYGPLRASRGAVWQSGDYDALKCMNIKPTQGITYTSARVRSLLVLRCPGAQDLSSANGKVGRNIDEAQLCKGAQMRETLTNVQVTGGGSIVSNGKTYTFKTVSESSFATVQQTPCRIPVGAPMPAPCFYISRTSTVFDQPEMKDQGYNAFSMLKFQNLVMTNLSDRFFSQGSVDFVFNDWQGRMIYNSPSNPPQWNATTRDGIAASGTYGEKNQLNLTIKEDVQKLGAENLKSLQRSFFR